MKPQGSRKAQTFVDDIFLDRPADYVNAAMRVYHSDANASFIGLPLRPITQE